MYRAFLLYISLSLLFSCTNEEEEKLREFVNSNITIDNNDTLESPDFSLLQYKSLELDFNKKYVADLEKLMNTSFDTQLNHFEDEELGFFAGYGYMFSFFFKTKQSWQDEMRLKSNKYFGTLNTEQEAYDLFLKYKKDISSLRKRFKEKYRKDELPSHVPMNLPEENISLSELSNHSRNNIAIEVVSEGIERIASWLLYPFILWLLSLIIPYNFKGCIAKVIVFFISLAVSVAISIWNDNRLLDQLREQHKEIACVDYSKILEQLNQNTISFYENN